MFQIVLFRKEFIGAASLQKLNLLFIIIYIMLFSNPLLFAQSEPEKVDIDIHADNSNAWHGQAWIWAFGLATFILLVVTFSKRARKKP